MKNDSIRRAVILAAGRGTRMGAMTEEIPKPMLPIGGKPMLEHIVGRLESIGIRKFLVVTGFGGNVIEKYCKGSKRNIECIRQDPVNGTASAALLAREFAADKTFLLSYGDILCDAHEYERAMEVMAKHAASAAVVAVKEVEDPWQGAAVYEVGGRITRIVEKPPKGTSVTRWNSAGFYLFKPTIFPYLARVELSARGEFELPSAIESMLKDRLELHISPIAGQWRDVGRPEDLDAARRATDGNQK